MKHLTLADEIIVLMLRDDTGAIRPARAASANIAIAGGLLMELALLGRIDTDLTSLFIVDPNPVGDELLDHVLREIAAEPVKQSSMWWINRFGIHGADLSGKVLGRLVEAGILREEDRQLLWVLSRRAYPKNSGREEREAKARLMSVIFDDVVPTPRDTLLLSLADSTGVLEDMLSSGEMNKVSTRIAQVIALEEIGRRWSRIAGGHRARWSLRASRNRSPRRLRLRGACHRRFRTERPESARRIRPPRC
jgi:golgi phosphoprotein 3